MSPKEIGEAAYRSGLWAPDAPGDPHLSIVRFAALVRAAALEEAARVAESVIDPEWPGDDMSVQAQDTASAIRALKG